MKAVTSWAREMLSAVRTIAANRGIVLIELVTVAMFAVTGMMLVGLSVVAFETAGASGVTILMLVQMVPTLLIVPVVSGLGDRLPRRQVLAVALAASGLAAAGIAAILAADGPLVAVYALAAVMAVSAGVIWATTNALLPTLARSPQELVAANVAATAAEGFGGLLGPVIATTLLLWGGPPSIALTAAVTMALGLLAALGIRPPPALPASLVVQRRVGVAGLVAEATAGLRTLLELPGPRLISLAIVSQTFVRGALTVLLVVLAFDLLGLGDAGVGMLTAAMGLGGLIGSALTMGVATQRPLGPLVGIALVGWGIPIVGLALTSATPVALVLMGIIGISNAVIDVGFHGLLQGTVPDRMRTGALGATHAVVSTGIALGSIAASLLLSIFDPRLVLALVGILLPALAVGLWQRWRTLDQYLLISREQVALLQACPIFAPLTIVQLEQLAAGMEEASFDPGAVIIREGDPGDAFYVLVGGEVAVSKSGRELTKLGPGGSFGELALLRNVPRSATVVASALVTAFRIDATTFVSAITGNPCSRAAAEDVAARLMPSASG